MPVSAEQVYAWHMRPGAFERLTPPWQRVTVEGEPTGLSEGLVKTLTIHEGPLAIRWKARHRALIEGRQFIDEQLSGPFARWEHAHLFEPAASGSVLRDRIRYALPGGPLGALAGGGAVERMLDRMFRYRHRVTSRDLERHAAFADRGSWRVAVTGATGLIGTALCAFLSTGGHQVDRLVRRAPRPGSTDSYWDPEAGVLDPAALEGVDAVVHLAGENLAGGPWTPERKRRILESREAGTRLVAEAIARMDRKPRVLLVASGAGYYGARDEEGLTEDSPAGEGFLAEVCRAWEAASAPAAEAGVRVVHLRLGVVLTPAGGALQKLLPPFLAGLGGPIGRGDQGLSWVSLEDVLGALSHAMFTDALNGPVNVTAPHPVSNAEFARTLARVLGRPAALPLPAPVVRAMFGEMGQATILEGQYVLPARLEGSGYVFTHPRLEEALREALGRPSS
ncbi:MAG: TIGR01777 family oxidoreductase [Candidatus Sericytochromatia bacterium]